MRMYALLILSTVSIFCASAANSLLKNYEALSKVDLKIRPLKSHVKRSDYYKASTNELEDDVLFDLKLGGTSYTIQLARVETPSMNRHFVSVNDINFDVNRLYEGYVRGHPESFVKGIINHEGSFEGRVSVGNETFLIESHHIVSSNDKSYDSDLYPTVAFRESDLSEENFRGLCGVTGSQYEIGLPPLPRPRRADGVADPNKNTCGVLIIADDKFTEAHGNNVARAVDTLIYVVSEAESIFRETVIGNKKNYGVQIESMRVYEKDKIDDDDYPFKGLSDNVGSSQYLQALSQWASRGPYPNRPRDQYCLIFSFTYRDFKGVLGEAYLKQTCQGYNQGIVTNNLAGNPRPKLFVANTFTHEVGHSWGSPHDTTPQCSPGGSDGMYLMHWQAQDLRKKNNMLFSYCSREAMDSHINGKWSSGNKCFKAQYASKCGNGRVEDGEECDCGYVCPEKCCNPPGSENECKLVDGKTCSPSASDCCTPECTPASSNEPCGLEEDCAERRMCPGGSSSTCPTKINVPSGTLCLNNSRTCNDEGVCMGSVCDWIGAAGTFEPCTCTAGQNIDSDKLPCVLCCKQSGSTCKPVNEIQEFQNEFDASMIFVRPGDLCTNGQGYCDVYQRCRKFAEEGFFLKLVKNLFSKERWHDFAVQYWWAMVLVVLGLILAIGVFVHFTAIYTPTQNPNLKDKQYHGPAHYVKKQVSVIQTKRQQSRDYPDGAKPKLTKEELKQKRLNKYAAKKRTVRQRNPEQAPLAPTAAQESVI